LFFASTAMILGNGQATKFLDGRWLDGRSVKEIAPSLYACIPKRRRKSRTVADGLQENKWATDIHGTLGIQEIGEYLQLWQKVEGTQLGQEPDHLQWKWTASGVYSAKSSYLATFHGSTTCPAAKHIWRTWAPQKVKFFLWLALQDRCWTAERLARRGLPHHPRCFLCDQLPETMRHLLIDCPFVKQVWHEALAWLRMTCRTPGSDFASLTDWIAEMKLALPKPLRQGFSTATLLIPWMLWKHRNNCVFNRA
jgi:cell wall assembly regulator SMI1